MVDINEFREVIEEAQGKASFACSELASLRCAPRFDEQYKLDRSGLTSEDLRRVWAAADAYALAVAELHNKAWGVE